MKQIIKQHKFTTEEIELATEFIGQIDINDFETVANYNMKTAATINETLKIVYDFLYKINNDTNIEHVNTFITADINNYHLTQNTGISAFFQSKQGKIEDVNKHAKAIDITLADLLEYVATTEQSTVKKLADFGKIYIKIQLHLKEVSVFCYAGINKHDMLVTTELPQLIEKASETGLHKHALNANNLKVACAHYYELVSQLLVTRDNAQHIIAIYVALNDSLSQLLKTCNHITNTIEKRYTACYSELKILPKANYDNLALLMAEFNECINEAYDMLTLMKKQHDEIYDVLKKAEKEIIALKSSK